MTLGPACLAKGHLSAAYVNGLLGIVLPMILTLGTLGVFRLHRCCHSDSTVYSDGSVLICHVFLVHSALLPLRPRGGLRLRARARRPRR